MKKKLTGIVMAVALLVVAFVPVAGHALSPQTDVTGVITNQGNPVNMATVTVVCNGVTKTDTTDSAGSYLVTFTAPQCPFGSTVKVTAQKGGYSGTASGTVHGITTKLNIAVVNVSIPEYGLIGGILATTAGIGAIAFTRRRFVMPRANMSV